MKAFMKTKGSVDTIHTRHVLTYKSINHHRHIKLDAQNRLIALVYGVVLLAIGLVWFLSGALGAYIFLEFALIAHIEHCWEKLYESKAISTTGRCVHMHSYHVSSGMGDSGRVVHLATFQYVHPETGETFEREIQTKHSIPQGEQAPVWVLSDYPRSGQPTFRMLASGQIHNENDLFLSRFTFSQQRDIIQRYCVMFWMIPFSIGLAAMGSAWLLNWSQYDFILLFL